MFSVNEAGIISSPSELGETSNRAVWFSLLLERRQEMIQECMDNFRRLSLQKMKDGEWTYETAAEKLDEFIALLKEQNKNFNKTVDLRFEQ